MSDRGPEEFAWFAHRPPGATRPVDRPTPPVRHVALDDDEFAGPWRFDGWAAGGDYESVHRLIGISRALYDDVQAWHRAVETARAPGPDTALYLRQQDLLRRLADEVRQGTAVDPARTERPHRVSMLRMRRVGGRLEVDEDGEVVDLPAISADLAHRVAAWVAESSRMQHANGDNDAEIFAWEDAGAALRGELRAALGSDFEVLMS